MKKLLALLLVCAAFAYPQGATSEMSGTVTDPQGAAIPAADVTVSNPDTGQAIKTASNEKGEWAVPALPRPPTKSPLPKQASRLRQSIR